MIARALNRAGIVRFREYLARLRDGCPEEPPRALLEDSAHSEALPVEVTVDQHAFPSRRALGAYLCELLAARSSEVLEENTGLWAWLSLYWFDEVCPMRSDGTRRAGGDYRHVPDFDFRHRYRHLVYGPYQVYRRHGPLSLVLLSGPVHEESELYQSITGRQDLIANRGVIQAALLLYAEPRSGALKRGCQPSQARPGTIRRFVRVLQQLDVTYDIYGMSGREILEVLPPEFDAWRPARSSQGTISG